MTDIELSILFRRFESINMRNKKRLTKDGQKYVIRRRPSSNIKYPLTLDGEISKCVKIEVNLWKRWVMKAGWNML